MDVVYASRALRSIETLRGRIGTTRRADEHPYEHLKACLRSLAREERPRRLHLSVRSRQA